MASLFNVFSDQGNWDNDSVGHIGVAQIDLPVPTTAQAMYLTVVAAARKMLDDIKYADMSADITHGNDIEDVIEDAELNVYSMEDTSTSFAVTFLDEQDALQAIVIFTPIKPVCCP